MRSETVSELVLADDSPAQIRKAVFPGAVRASKTRAAPRSRERTAPRMRDDPQVTELVTRARDGDQQAWHALVERYSPLIWSLCCRCQLSGTDAEDVSQTVWLRLVDQLGNLRDPAALPGWIVTTARRECYRVQRFAVGPLLDEQTIPDEKAATADHELLIAERHAALREAVTRLPSAYQRLLALLIAEPPVPYAEISARLGMPVGSIGPTRRRCLDKLRRDPAIAALIDAEAASVDAIHDYLVAR